MTSHVHEFEAREGGSFRISLTYDAPTGTGKSAAHTDTYHGRFVKLAPDYLSRADAGGAQGCSCISRHQSDNRRCE